MKKTVLYTGSAVKPAKFFILDKTGYLGEYFLKERNIIGRKVKDSNADVKLNSSIVSRSHGEIVSLEGEYFYRDLMSANGTYINGKIYGKKGGKLRTARKLENGDIIKFDIETNGMSHPEAVIMIFSREYEENIQWFTQELTDNMSEIKIGRNTTGEQNLRIENEMVSQNHASFFRAQLGWAIIDHKSKNGVFLCAKKITEPVYLNEYDVIKIANMYFVFFNDKIIFQNVSRSSSAKTKAVTAKTDKDLNGLTATNPGQLMIHITERSVWQRFKKQTLLKNIKMTINNGEMVMILGGSGAGKTTLMNAVMGYEKAEGKILHGQTDIYEDYETMKYEIGYVPQQDLLRDNDTVYQTLKDAAMMKLPKKTTESKQNQRIEEVMSILGLSRERNSLVSKLSGGQRKRLSIAVEYIANPSLFFLDEPDSGLDGIMAKSLNENLRLIADTGKIIMVITHSPDRVSSLYNKVIVLAKSAHDNSGQLAFFGSVPDALKFFDSKTLEGVVKRINRPDEGGEGKSDFYIEKFKTYAAKEK